MSDDHKHGDVHFTGHRMVGGDRNAPAPKPLTFQAVHRMAGYYHVLDCPGDCDILFGCAPQWQADEVERMMAHGVKNPPALNRIKPQETAMPADLCHCPADLVMRDPKTGHCAVCGDYAKLRSKTSAERKAEPIHSGVFMYFPDALAAVSRLSKAGNDKHNPGEPLHWSRGKSNDHADCVARHSLTPDAVDDTGETELVAQVWRSLALLQLQQEKLLAARGILPYSGITP